VADVPDLDAALATRVHVSGGVADGHCTHHLPVVEGVDLASMSGDSRSNEGVRRKGDRLHLAVCTNMEGVCSKAGESGEKGRRQQEKCYLTAQCNNMKRKTFLPPPEMCKQVKFT
jgi:hypothetical protein